ncbi:MAG: lysozyme inhibitor LprI family protein, partial [Methylocella sp.]
LLTARAAAAFGLFGLLILIPAAAFAQAPPGAAPAPVAGYAPAIFQKPVAADRMAFLQPMDRTPAGTVIRDKRYRKLMDAVVPDSLFHYGRDMPLAFALQGVFEKSSQPAQIRDGRYLLLSSSGAGRAFMWMDLQAGIALGGIFFRPSNGEPTPTLTVFSRQVKVSSLAMSQLPPAFAEDLGRWQRQARVPAVSPRYFITGGNTKILLEHDEDYCAPGGGPAAPADCVQMNAAAADIDLNTANYLEQTHHATNATARMIFEPEQLAWFQLRDRSCLDVPDRLGCRIRLTRERTRIIIQRTPRKRH